MPERLKFGTAHKPRWDADKSGIVFEGDTATETVQFIVKAEALAYLVDPQRGNIDAKTSREVFAKHEADICAVARKLYWRMGGQTQPIVLRREDMPALI